MPRSFPERFQIAFSFAGEQRALVERIATEVEKLLGAGGVFYDEWYEHVIAGHDGDVMLQSIYSKGADLVVVCVSADYGGKPWTLIEHEEIRALYLRLRASGRKEDRLRVLPIRVGEGEVPGIPSNAICPDVRQREPARSARLIVDRLNEWKSYSSPVTIHHGTVLLTPAVAALSAVAEQVEDWLEEQRIKVLRLDPTREDDGSRKAAIREAVNQAAVIVDWIQRAADPGDSKFRDLAEEILAEAARAGKPVLRWLSPDAVALEEDCKDGRTRRLPLETFKKEVLRTVAEPPREVAAAVAGEVARLPSRLVIAAAGVDTAALEKVLGALPEFRSRDARLDDRHCAPEFGQTPDWDEEVKDALRRKGVTVALFIDGACQRSWIDRRLRAFDVYREELPERITLIVWDVPLAGPKERRFFIPDFGHRIQSAAVEDLVGELPP